MVIASKIFNNKENDLIQKIKEWIFSLNLQKEVYLNTSLNFGTLTITCTITDN